MASHGGFGLSDHPWRNAFLLELPLVIHAFVTHEKAPTGLSP